MNEAAVSAPIPHRAASPAARDLPVGGQAVLEGVMMRGPKSWAVAVRLPADHPADPSGIAITTEEFRSVLTRHRALRLPIVRGAVALVESMGIGVRAPKQKQEESVYKLACATAEKLGCAGVVQRADVVANTDYVGKGYGIPAASTIEAIRMFAELEGILLDPVYSGKGAAGLIDLIRKGHFKKGERIVFIHTGGSTALFGYLPAFDAMAHAADQATA